MAGTENKKLDGVEEVHRGRQYDMSRLTTLIRRILITGLSANTSKDNQCFFAHLNDLSVTQNYIHRMRLAYVSNTAHFRETGKVKKTF